MTLQRIVFTVFVLSIGVLTGCTICIDECCTEQCIDEHVVDGGDGGGVAVCWDDDPCSVDFYSEKYGCLHEQVPTGTSCYGDFGIGV